VDNDPTRFTVDLLQKWKAAAEAAARKRVGKTATTDASASLELKLHERVSIPPIIPRQAEQAEWSIIRNSDGSFLFQKLDSGAQVEIPASFIEEVHRFYAMTPALVQLVGRLQWNSVDQRWRLMWEKPESGRADNMVSASTWILTIPGERITAADSLGAGRTALHNA
jgi:hypothetical protein